MSGGWQISKHLFTEIGDDLKLENSLENNPVGNLLLIYGGANVSLEVQQSQGDSQME